MMIPLFNVRRVILFILGIQMSVMMPPANRKRKARSQIGETFSSVSFNTQKALPQVKAARNSAKVAIIFLYELICFFIVVIVYAVHFLQEILPVQSAAGAQCLQ